MPAAMPVEDAMGQLKEYQSLTKKTVKIHGCFIKDENDSVEDMVAMISMLKETGLDVEYNIVRYNPYSEEQGVEADQLAMCQFIKLWNDYMPGKKIQIIPRVGPDVYASCGTFYEN